MAVIQNTGTNLSGALGKVALVTWTALATSDTGTPISNPSFADRSVQVGGTFGGATCIIEGSNDGVTYATLTDTAGAALSFTTAGVRQVLQVTRFIRPSVSGGAAVSINVNLLTVGK
jgi:hypothetical protein